MWRLALVIVVLTVALYGRHIASAAFVYEDGQARQAVMAETWGRPLSTGSWLLTRTPQAAHAVSVALHLAVVGLMGLLAWRLGYSREGAGLVALFAAFHPLTTEAVAYAVARSELLAALGVLMAVVCATGRWWQPWPVVGIVAGLVVGWLSKETAILGLALVPLTMALRWRVVHPPDLAWLWAGVAVWLLASAAWLATGLETVTGLLTVGGSPRWFVTLSDAPAWALAQSAAAYRLMGLTLWPIGLTVDPDIDLLPTAYRVVAVVSLVGVSAWAWLIRRTMPYVAYGLTWTLLCFAPRLLVQTPRSYLNEHQFYLPLMGLILAGVAWWESTQQERLTA